MFILIRITYILTYILLCACTQKTTTNTMKTSKIVIAHRGASAYLPEHTLPAKAMAYAMNPQYIEQDVVLSKDDVPIVIHDIHLETVTNVKEVFPNRKRPDGSYYVIDFTFEELKKLQVKERFNPTTNKNIYASRFPQNKSRFGLHSLAEEIELIQGLNYSTKNNIGIYPEIKEPDFHLKEGKDISKIVLNTLNHYGYNTKTDNCILQCFDAKELERIRKHLKSNIYLVQLFENESDIINIPHYATYADALGPWYNLLAQNKLLESAKIYNLPIHTFTMRADDYKPFQNFEKLLEKVFNEYQVDGVFTDHPDVVLKFLNKNNE